MEVLWCGCYWGLLSKDTGNLDSWILLLKIQFGFSLTWTFFRDAHWRAVLELGIRDSQTHGCLNNIQPFPSQQERLNSKEKNLSLRPCTSPALQPCFPNQQLLAALGAEQSPWSPLAGWQWLSIPWCWLPAVLWEGALWATAGLRTHLACPETHHHTQRGS